MLESRSLLSVSVGSDGWTDVTKSGDSKVIYVSSSSGSDSNNGSSGSPVRTISKGISMMRSGYPDHLLLKRGDSWTERLNWSKSGRNSQEPALLGTYGSGARPVIKAGSGNALEMASGNVNHLVIQGIHLFAHTRDPNASGFSSSAGGVGIRFLAGTTGLLIEDTVVDQFRFGINLQDHVNNQSNIKIRRSIITDSYSNSGGHSQGLYADGVNGLTLEENVFDHNGWNSKVSGGGATPQNHNAYITSRCNNVAVKGNIFADASAHGLQARAGGEIRDNLFIRNPVHMSYGLVNGGQLKAGGVSGVVDGNVFLEGRNIGSSPRGWAIELGNIKGATVRNNIINDDGPGTAAAIKLNVGKDLTNSGSGVGINNLVIEDNVVHKWHRAMELSGDLNIGGSGNSGLNNLTVRDNEFQNSTDPNNYIVWHSDSPNKSEEFFSNNKYYDEISSSKWFVVGGNVTSLSSWQSKLESTAKNAKVSYNNPYANISSYAGSYSSYMTEARKASSSNWRTTYTARGAINYMRGAFNKSSSAGSEPTPTQVVEPTSGGGTPSIDVTDASISEGNSGTRSLLIPVKLSQASSQQVKVNYATSNKTAGEGDYGVTSGSVTFAPGETSKSISIVIKGDTKIESNEQFAVNLSGASNATIVDNQAIATIVNDDGVASESSSSTPELRLSGGSRTEGDSGTRLLSFNATLSDASSQTVKVDYETDNKTAGEGDYGVTSGTVTFAPGETSKTINVVIKGDTKPESDEAFVLRLSDAINAILADDDAIGTIENDD